MSKNIASDTATCLLWGSCHLERIEKKLPAEDVFDIVESVICRLGMGNPILPPETLANYYPENYYSYQEMADKQKVSAGMYEQVGRFIRIQTYQDHYLHSSKKHESLCSIKWFQVRVIPSFSKWETDTGRQLR